MTKVIGKEGISAEVVTHSISPGGVEILTYELEYPRFILSELNTHRMLSKNSASSRAIPIKTMIAMILENPAMPVYWGKNQPGMSAKSELGELAKTSARMMWVAASKVVVSFVSVLDDMGLHKQISNRLLEPWCRMKTVVTGTEFDNFFYLRDHEDAQPEIRELARVMKEAKESSKPMLIFPGEWHLPYIQRTRDRPDITFDITYFTEETNDSGRVERNPLSLEDAKCISVSCTAQVSYRKNDDSLEKAKKVYEMLNLDSTEKPQHASPTEHQATPALDFKGNPKTPWQEGVTHMSRSGLLWSGNLRMWVQNRQLLCENKLI